MTKKEYDYAYYRRNKQKRAAQSKARNAANKDVIAERAKANKKIKKAFCRRFKLASACFDCGYNEQVEALEFDHINGVKKKHIGSIYGQGWPEFLNELEKCVVRCANCHSIRTHRREQ